MHAGGDEPVPHPAVEPEAEQAFVLGDDRAWDQCTCVQPFLLQSTAKRTPKSFYTGRNGWRCGVGTLLRVRDSGSLTVTISVGVGRSRQKRVHPLSINELTPLIRLTPSTWEQRDSNPEFVSQLTQPATGEPQTLDQLYGRAIEWASKAAQIAPLYPQMLNMGPFDKRPPPQYVGRDDVQGIQVPYLVIDGELANDSFEHFFCSRANRPSELREHQESLLPQLAVLLLRFFSPDAHDKLNRDSLIREFALSYQRPIIPSMNVNEDVFTYLHRGAAICLTRKRDTAPSRFVLPSFLDVVEAYRARRHSLMVANLMLDWLLADLSATTPWNAEVWQNSFDRAEEVRRALARQLVDPHLAMLDGHLGYDIMKVLHERLGLGAVQNEIATKLGIADSIIDHRDLVGNMPEESPADVTHGDAGGNTAPRPCADDADEGKPYDTDWED